MAEPPYGVIWNKLNAGKVVPFLGAGASGVGRAAEAHWEHERPAFLPSGAELSEFLAAEAQYPSDADADRQDLAKVSSYYTDVSGREELRERLHYVFAHDFQPGALHHLLASVEHPMLIVATNYDTLLEQAFKAARKPYDLVVHPTDRKEYQSAVLWWRQGAEEPEPVSPNELNIDVTKTTVIYKMHGSIAEPDPKFDSFVITEEDYVDFLSRMTARRAVPAMFFKHCRERSFLFLGYSLRDWNLRVILKNLRRALPRQSDQGKPSGEPSWAIQRRPTEVECRLWQKRGVDIFDMDMDQFVARMSHATGHAR